MFEELIFYGFATILLISALMVILVRNAVHAILFLVMTFFCAAALWLLLEKEFLALVLVLVYVGAVMTLFLFVVMMLNLNLAKKRRIFVSYLPLGMFVFLLIVSMIFYVEGPQHFGLNKVGMPVPMLANYSNISALGALLYTDYVYPFELAAILLLAAIIAAVSLSLRKPRSKFQKALWQLQVEPEERLRLIKMATEKREDIQ